MKKMIFFMSILIMCIVFKFSLVYADGIEKEYSKEYKEYLQMSDEQKSKLNIIPEKYDVTYDEFIKQKNANLDTNKSIVSATSLDKRFSLEDVINIHVEEQGKTSWCWAYTSLKCAETNYLLHVKNNGLSISGLSKTSINLAEYHLAYGRAKELGGWDSDVTFSNAYDSGGNFSEFKTYSFEEHGPITGTDAENIKYTNKTSLLSKLNNSTPALKVTKTVTFPTIRKNYDSNGKLTSYNNISEDKVKEIRKSIKEHILTNGSLYAVTNLSNYDNGNTLYLYNDDIVASHAVSIIGWDDNYKKEYFSGTNKPKNDGAYIVLNSWGKDWGNDGIYYVSYDDALIERRVSGVEEVIKYNKNPQITVRIGDYSTFYEHIPVYIDSDKKLKDMDKIGWEIDKKDNNSTYITYVKNYTEDTSENFNVCSLYGNSSNTTNVKFTVKPSIYFDKDNVVIDLSSSNTQTINVMNQNNIMRADFYSWSSSDKNIATVSQGVITGISNGVCTIKAHTSRSGKTLTCNVTVRTSPTGISLNKTVEEINLNNSNSVVLSASITPSSANYNSKISWTSSDTEIATVDSTGKVTALSTGQCYITAKTENNLYVKCKVIIKRPITSIKLDSTNITLTERVTSEKLTASILPTNAENKKITWTSSNTKVATVTNGTVTAVGNGTCKITASAQDGSGVKAECNVVVNKATLVTSGIQNNFNYEIWDRQGKKFAVILEYNGSASEVTIPSTIAGYEVERAESTFFTNSQVKKITISNGIKELGWSFCCNCKNLETVVVPETIEQIDDDAFLGCGNIKNIQLNLKMEQNKSKLLLNYIYNISNTSYVFKSSNEKIVRVDAEDLGVITAVSGGTCVITGTGKNGVIVTCKVIIGNIVTSIKLDKSSCVLNKTKNTVKLTSTLLPENASNKNVIWSSSNTSVATVDKNGNVTVVSNGSCVITCQAQDGSNVSATCNVTVDMTLPTAPVIKVSKINSATGANYTQGTWTNQNIYVEFASTDSFGEIDHYEWKRSDTNWSTDYMQSSVGTSNGIILFTVTRNATVYLRSVDKAGNTSVETEYKVMIDKVVPTVSLSKNGGEYVITPNNTQIAVKQTITVVDNGELDVLKYQYSKSERMPQITDSNWKTFTSGKEFSENLQGGKYYLYTYVKDKAGNVATNIQKSNVFNIKMQVAYNANGGTEVMATDTVSYGDNYVTKQNSFKRKGYEFKGWNEKADGTGVDWTDWVNKGWKWTYTKSITLYAQWKPKTYKINYHSNGGMGTILSQTVTYNTKYKLANNTFTKNGYSATKDTDESSKCMWTTNNNGTYDDNGWKSGTEWTWHYVNDEWGISNDTLDLYAMWTANTYTVKYNGNGATSGSTADSTHTYDKAQKLTKNGYSKTGCIFIGWSTSTTATDPIYTDEQSVTNLATSGEVTLYAVWANINVSPASMKLDMSGTKTQQLTITGNCGNVTYESSNNSVATVSSTGLITAKGNGTCVIAVKGSKGNLSRTCSITVQTSVTSITLDKTSATLELSGIKEVTLKATINPSTANVGNTITWISSNTNVATVDSTGKVTAKANGTCVITAKTGNGKTATCSITVQTSVTSITLNKTALVFTDNNMQELLVKVILPTTASNKNVTYTSSNEKIAKVDEEGKVTPISNGECSIIVTAKDGSGVKATCNVTVKLPYQKGDYNLSGKIDVTDAYLLLTSIAKNEVLDSQRKTVMDMNNDNKIDVTDAYLLLRKIANS